MKHWHIWRKDSPTISRREDRPYKNTATPSRIIQREERFKPYGGRVEACEDPKCWITAEDVKEMS